MVTMSDEDEKNLVQDAQAMIYVFDDLISFQKVEEVGFKNLKEIKK